MVIYKQYTVFYVALNINSLHTQKVEYNFDMNTFFFLSFFSVVLAESRKLIKLIYHYSIQIMKIQIKLRLPSLCICMSVCMDRNSYENNRHIYTNYDSYCTKVTRDHWSCFLLYSLVMFVLTISRVLKVKQRNLVYRLRMNRISILKGYLVFSWSKVKVTEISVFCNFTSKEWSDQSNFQVKRSRSPEVIDFFLIA